MMSNIKAISVSLLIFTNQSCAREGSRALSAQSFLQPQQDLSRFLWYQLEDKVMSGDLTLISDLRRPLGCCPGCPTDSHMTHL